MAEFVIRRRKMNNSGFEFMSTDRHTFVAYSSIFPETEKAVLKFGSEAEANKLVRALGLTASANKVIPWST
jgi:hypothetical protein